LGAQFDWPQWRGPNRDGISKETGLLKEWPANGPKRLWLFEKAGNGYSGPAIVAGKFYTMGTREGSEILLALDANTGKELWTSKLAEVYQQTDHGTGPRGTPTIDGDKAYVMTSDGSLICASAADGKVIWKTTMSELGGRVPHWGYSESVLADGDHVICTPGGSKGAIAALDKTSGKLVWQSKDFTDEAQYSSIVLAKMNGAAEYVQRTMKSIVGVSPQDGKVLWKTDFQGRTAVIPTPIVRDNIVYVSAGYSAGCKEVKIGPNYEVETVFENKVMKNHHGGVVLVGDHLYGHNDPTGWVCQDFKTGEEVWSYREFKKGAIGYADGMLYCVEESTGTTALVEASPAGWKEHGRLKLEPQSKIRDSQGRVWTHPVVSNGKLYLRDQEYIYCYSVGVGAS
jgi:outer membrane protein assembly factor BamB